MKSITVSELKALMDNQAAYQLIDVREDYEYEAGNINGLHIPMNDVPNQVEQIAKDKQVIVQCRSGMRSANVIQFLETNYQLENLYNLEGGIKAWVAEIDPSIEVA